jgi:hypothetical protein
MNGVNGKESRRVGVEIRVTRAAQGPLKLIDSLPGGRHWLSRLLTGKCHQCWTDRQHALASLQCRQFTKH